MRARHFLSILLIQMVGILLISCAPMQKTPFNALDLNPKLQEGYIKKVDNFLVILDASTSMYTDQNNRLGEPAKLEIAKDFVSNMNKTIPALDLQGGMRVFGPYMNKSNLVYGMEKYNKEGLEKAVQAVKSTQGLTPLAQALDLGSTDLEAVSGRTAAIVVSDGEPTDSDAVQSAKNMKARYGDRLCLYTVQVGKSPAGEELLKKVADAGGCGFSANADSLTAPATMADFVEKVFLEKALIKEKPAEKVVENPAENPAEKVAEKPAVAELKEKVSIELMVQFDFDRSDVKPEFHDDIKKVANFLNAYPNTKVELEGHTCSIGTDAYNLKLSERRADGVQRYLVDKLGIPASRITAKGFGESRPVTANDTKAGRILNRRVTANIMTIIVK